MPRLVRIQIPDQSFQLTAEVCDTFLCQLRGLTFRRDLPPEWGLLLTQKRETRLDAAIHMMFMRIDLGVIWLNSAGKVVDTCLARRWRLAYFPRHPARYILETSVDYLPYFRIGERVQIVELD